MDLLTLIAPVIASCIALVSFYFSSQRASKSDVAANENRLTKLELNQFTQEDRKCLYDNTVKMGLLWDTMKHDFPSFLKRTTTPMVDLLLSKAEKDLHSLTQTEITKLLDYLNCEVEEARVTEKPERAVIAAFYRSVVRYETKQLTAAENKEKTKC